MKRNESILVYGVTGLLAVILVVAVVFGNGAMASMQTDGGQAGASSLFLSFAVRCKCSS